MAADWGVYMNNDLGHLASVGVDLEYRDTGPVSSYPTLVIVGMRFKAPRQNGLPQKDELQIVYAIEDRLSDLLGNKTNSRYVGHKLADGSAKFFFYASDAAVVTAAAKTVGVDFSAYPFDLQVVPDASWSVYRTSLVPSGDNVQQVEDNKVIQVLTNHGDDIAQPRIIDHFAYFSEVEGLQSFKSAILSRQFHVDDEASPAQIKGKWLVKFYRLDIPDEITSVTVELAHLAEEYNGEYDGWECAVTPAHSMPTKP
ncbi:DUF695 domain-containing protein [Rhizobium sp. BK376]|uniref:DUF695 domain-containing protein n=1 Tax=Rhizobium sp. BK376 TaxID=2512149 RepID=UPI00104A529C|nr:DUF695 domain-containing protein [Rhizobium sp. BK376]TCR91323.1 uncharacterized protein (TIGR01619 family) [Rhizobium sp. BK376]